MKTDNRPLSPHIQIYRWQWTMAYSILHRATGIALSAGSLLLAWWLIALASGPDAFDTCQAFIASPLGRLLLLGWTWSVFYHLGNGIRHLLWDSGRGFALTSAARSGHFALGFSIIATILIWIAGYAAL